MHTPRVPLKNALARLVLALLAASVLAGCRTAADSAPAQTLRVMSWNIHHGEGLDGQVDLDRIAGLIKAERADLVALQEVDKGTQRTARRDFPAELAALTGMTCVFSNNYHFEGGEYGNAVLTRFPVTSWTNTHYRMLRPAEQRGILQVVLDVHGCELVLMNTHIDFRPDDSERLSNVEEIRGLSQRHQRRPIVLCGDFNDTPGSRTYQRLSELFLDSWTTTGNGDGFTIPARQPRKRIDYIWLSKEGALVPLKTWVPQSAASDHLPVVAELQLQSRPATR